MIGRVGSRLAVLPTHPRASQCCQRTHRLVVHEERRLLGCNTVALVRTDVSEESIASIIRNTILSVLQLLVTDKVVPTSLIIFHPDDGSNAFL
jgi:hypothetical protein